MLQNQSILNWNENFLDAKSSPDLIKTRIIHIIVWGLYILIFLLGLCGNLLVCYVVVTKPPMHSVTNYFIMNLSLADILLCLIAVPFTPVYSFLGEWIFGPFICHLVPYVQSVSVYLSTCTLTCIAVDRFIVIVYRLRTRISRETCFKVIAIVWIISIILSIPYGVYIEMKLHNNQTYVCEENWPSDKIYLVFGIVNFSLQFVLPFILIVSSYTAIAHKIRTHTASNRNSHRRRLNRTNRMLIAMVAIFVICWLPLNVINILYDFKSDLINEHFRVYFLICHCLAMSSTCYNPFLYAWLSPSFRNGFETTWSGSQVFFTCCASRSLPNSFSENSVSGGVSNVRTSLFANAICDTPHVPKQVVELM